MCESKLKGVSTNIVQLTWKRYSYDDVTVKTLNNGCDYGIYQIYGTHPVFGEDVLLYIGKAQDQTFWKRFSQHDDFIVTNINHFSRIHVGRLIESNFCTKETWGNVIDHIEPLLINAHLPPYNAKDIKGVLSASEYLEYHVLNYGDLGSLLPEVSGFRYSNLLWNEKMYPFIELTET